MQSDSWFVVLENAYVHITWIYHKVMVNHMCHVSSCGDGKNYIMDEDSIMQSFS